MFHWKPLKLIASVIFILVVGPRKSYCNAVLWKVLETTDDKMGLMALILNSWPFPSGTTIRAPQTTYGTFSIFLFNRKLQRIAKPGDYSLISSSWLPLSISHQNIMSYICTYLNLVVLRCLWLLTLPSVPSWHSHCFENWRTFFENAHLTIGFCLFFVMYY